MQHFEIGREIVPGCELTFPMPDRGRGVWFRVLWMISGMGAGAG
jgi:hypothetical protein